MELLKKYTDMVEKRLYDFLPPSDTVQGRAVKAALHSLSAGGKRIRPVLTIKFCEMCGGSAEKALDTACAIEYLHTFSLIHDDLPCMDNDDMRRGKPSCHKAFDEPTALLAGDALAIMPFGIISRSAVSGAISPAAAVKASDILCEFACFGGMIGGQQIDTEYEGRDMDENLLLSMYSMKTSALLKAACCCGVVCAESADEAGYLRKADEFAENLGLAFQIIDDILDVTSTQEMLGKPIGSDEKSGKRTFVAVNGLEAAEKAAELYTEKAKAALRYFPDNGFMLELTDMLLKRKK